MNDSTSKSRRAKREFYSRSAVAQTFDEQRFGGRSGAWVNAREIEVALSLAPNFRRALDLGCGTGRLTRQLANRGECVGIDISAPMLSRARQETRAGFVQGDAFALPFGPASFEVVFALRVAFHFRELDSLLAEARRILQPRGRIILDTYTWSPRALVPLDTARWGTGVYIHPRRQMAMTAQRLGLAITGQISCFLFSPYLYRRLPFSIVQALARLEPRVPPRLLNRVFWRLERLDP